MRPTPLARVRDALNRVSEHPWCFLFLLCALRFIVRPYPGLTHDARLYSVAVLNKISGGFFARDLFFAFGSQDSLSLYSTLMAPLMSATGVYWATFLAYMVSICFLIWVEIRLVRQLVPNRLLANLTLILLVISDLPYGSHRIFHIHETFMTARIPTIALVLLGIDMMLRRRYVVAMLLPLVSMTLHPLMGVSGLFIVAGSICAIELPRRWLIGLGAAVVSTAAVVVLYQPLGMLVFGYIDPEWSAIARRRIPYCFISNWWPTDWFRIAGSLPIVLIGARFLDRRAALTMWSVALLAVAGIVGTFVAEVYPYALLLQAQPYRAMWPLQVFAVPMGVLAMFRLWQHGTHRARFASLAVMCFTWRVFLTNNLLPDAIGATCLVVLCMFLLFSVFYRVRPAAGDGQGWFWPSALAALITSGVLISVEHAASFVVWGISQDYDPFALIWLLPARCSDILIGGVAILFIVGLWAIGRDARKTGILAAALWIGVSTTTFLARDSFRSRDSFVRDHADIEFIRQVMESRHEDDSPPVIYWPTQIVHIWFDLPAQSYFNLAQTAGAVFNRGTSIEGERRAMLVRRFEIAIMRKLNRREAAWKLALEVYQTDFDEPDPTADDLLRLCREEDLDFVAIKQKIDGVECLGNGHVYVYDCDAIRSNHPSDTAVAVHP